MLSGEGFVVTGIQKYRFVIDVTFSLRGNECSLVFLDYKPIHDEGAGVVKSVQSLKLRRRVAV